VKISRRVNFRFPLESAYIWHTFARKLAMEIVPRYLTLSFIVALIVFPRKSWISLFAARVFITNSIQWWELSVTTRKESMPEKRGGEDGDRDSARANRGTMTSAFPLTLRRMPITMWHSLFIALLLAGMCLNAEPVDHRDFAIDIYYPKPNEVRLAEERTRQ